MTEIYIVVETSFTTPTGGWSVNLSKAVPQGINESILILEVVATPPAPGTVVTQAFQEHRLTYTEEMTAGHFYESVDIRKPNDQGGGVGITE